MDPPPPPIPVPEISDEEWETVAPSDAESVRRPSYGVPDSPKKWCHETLFQNLKGVLAVVLGAGGSTCLPDSPPPSCLEDPAGEGSPIESHWMMYDQATEIYESTDHDAPTAEVY